MVADITYAYIYRSSNHNTPIKAELVSPSFAGSSYNRYVIKIKVSGVSKITMSPQ